MAQPSFDGVELFASWPVSLLDELFAMMPIRCRGRLASTCRTMRRLCWVTPCEPLYCAVDSFRCNAVAKAAASFRRLRFIPGVNPRSVWGAICRHASSLVRVEIDPSESVIMSALECLINANSPLEEIAFVQDGVKNNSCYHLRGYGAQRAAKFVWEHRKRWTVLSYDSPHRESYDLFENELCELISGSIETTSWRSAPFTFPKLQELRLITAVPGNRLPTLLLSNRSLIPEIRRVSLDGWRYDAKSDSVKTPTSFSEIRTNTLNVSASLQDIDDAGTLGCAVATFSANSKQSPSTRTIAWVCENPSDYCTCSRCQLELARLLMRCPNVERLTLTDVPVSASRARPAATARRPGPCRSRRSGPRSPSCLRRA
jgi:hypothetical protein